MDLDTIEYRGFYIHITSDEYAEDPRKMFDPMGHMVCFHNRYSLGDDHNFSSDTVFDDLAMEVCPNFENTIEFWNNEGYRRLQEKHGHESAYKSVEQKLESTRDKIINRHYVILELYLYDHPGITMRTGPFSCPWDSGNVGFIYMTMDEVTKEYGTGLDAIDKAIKYMKGEVETYDAYISGQVYGYHVEPKETNKDIECDDSCSGFYGETDYMVSEAKSRIDHTIKTWAKERVDQVKTERNRKIEMNAFMSNCWAY